MRSESDAARRLNLLAIVIESPCDDRLGAVFVRCGRIGRKRISNGIIELFVISPVRATFLSLEIFLYQLRRGDLEEGLTCLRVLTLCAQFAVADVRPISCRLRFRNTEMLGEIVVSS